MMDYSRFEEGMIAVVKQRSGNKYVAIYTLAPGIDYFWSPIIKGSVQGSLFTNPEVSAEVIGKVL